MPSAWLEERVALYADDFLLFLNDADSSLKGALQVLTDFSKLTGLGVNWTKSQLLAIDPEAKRLALPDLQLQWVDKMVYLGVRVLRDASSFIPLNLKPVVQGVKAKLKA